MLEMMLVLKDDDMQRVLGYDPEPVEKLKKLQRALDRGHIPQRFLEELLGDSMAVEAEQVQRMNQHTHLSWEMEQLSEASSHILESQTLQAMVQEMQGASVDLQDSSLRCTELQEENQQLQKQKEHLEIELQKEKNSSQEWEALTEELVKALEQLLKEVDTLKADRALQMANWETQLHKEKENTQKWETISKAQYQALLDEHSRYKTLLLRSLEVESKAFRRREQDQLQHEAALQELRDLVSAQREALTQVQEANVLAAQEERLPQEERVNFWNQLMMAEQKELHTESQEMQSSLEIVQGEVRLWKTQYEGAKEELQSMEISLKKLRSQCEVLSHEKENFQEENLKLKRKIQTLAKRNRKLLKENEKDKAWRKDKLNNLSTITEEQEETVMDSYESWGPVPQNRKKWWTRARAFINFFKPKINGSGEPAKQPQHSPTGPLEATPSCSYWVEEQDAPSGPPPKAAWSKKNKGKNKDKCPAARPAVLKRFQSSSSLNIPPPSK